MYNFFFRWYYQIKALQLKNSKLNAVSKCIVIILISNYKKEANINFLIIRPHI